MFICSRSSASVFLLLMYMKSIAVSSQSLTGKGKFDFGPNQLASNIWYRPRGQLINGHYGNSYSNFSFWPNLQVHLRTNNGSIIIQASEIGYMTNDELRSFRDRQIPIIAALPAFTQCYDSTLLALLELYGQSQEENLFCKIFDICNSTDREDPNGKGWFSSRDGFSYTPDLLNMDERMPNLVPYLDYDNLINRTVNPPEWFYPNLSWNDRKSMARVDPCPQAGSDRISNLTNDYLRYISVVNEKFHETKIPRIQINWNVNVVWEWRDESCLDLLYDQFTNAQEFDYAYRYITHPCHQDTQHLKDLVQLLCSKDQCPEVVYMDIDLIYLTSYALDVLHMNKEVLKTLNVSFGINLVDQCVENENCVAEILPSDKSRVVLNLNASSTYPNYTRNQMQELSLTNILTFLINQNLVDEDTHIAIISWTTWPMEIGEETIESNSGGMAYTANQIFKQILIPHSFAR